MKTIAFMNQKGGVGKTTTAVSIGSILANDFDKRVLLVDLDPQGNMTDHVGIDPNEIEKTVYNLLIDQLPVDEVISKFHNMDILPANIDLSAAEVELASMMSRELRLKNALETVKNNYDYILLDCPPSLGLLTISGLAMADEVVVPMQAEYLALRGLSQLVHTVDLVSKHLNPGLNVSGVVFCMFDGRTLLAKGVHAEVENYFPGKVYATGIRKNIRLAEAPSHGQPVNIYDPRCAGSEDYRSVTGEFLRRQNDPNAPEEDAFTPQDCANTPEQQPPQDSQETFDRNPPPEIRPVWKESSSQ